MALYRSPKQRFARFIFAITSLVLGIGENCYARTTTEVYSAKVDVCPQNQTEWQEASRRLKCSDDAKSPVNKYHCLPVYNLTSLLEFCYSGHRPQVVKGLCLTYVQEINNLDSYNCTTFDDGCPDTFYHSDETYKFPKCTEIDPFNRCYVADSSCRKNTTVNETSTSKTTQKSTDNKIAIIVSTSVVLSLGAVICIVATVVIKRRKCNCIKGKGISRKGLIEFCFKVKAREGVKMPLLNVDKAYIKRLGLNYLLERLPTDEESILEIAKKLNVPPEIVRWSRDNRQRFVKSMKKGTIPVYSRRGMVIGCAEAGKTTLVKKLKGENNISTTSTIGFDIYAHEFKLDAEECTIISCMQNEKDKGCLYIHPAAVDQKKEINTEKGEPSQSDSEETDPEYATHKQEEKRNIGEDKRNYLVPTLSFTESVPDIELTNLYAEAIPDTFPVNKWRSYSEVYQHSEDQFSQDWDFSDCVASTNENSLKVLGILDFAGQSAYYACHHIFFSPRAFYILVVDMSKDLKGHADRACDKEGLIYSDWTYADYITYWLGSIHTYGSKSAPVILVASHSESIGSDPNKKKFLEYFFEICGTVPKCLRRHLDKERAFSVEKNSDKNMKELKKCIASTLKGQNHWGEDVPVAWTKLESVLRKIRETVKIYPFSNLFETVKKIKDLQINNEEELITALNFFHDTGVILFQKEKENIVILDVQWFVDAFKCIIIDERHYENKDVDNCTDFDVLKSHGLLTGKLLDALWRDKDFLQYKEELINHMVDLNMLANLNSEEWYVPCMNKQKYTQSILNNCNVSSTLCFVFEFLPFVIFHRLVVTCINNMNMTLWQHGGQNCIFHTVVVLKCKNKTQQVLIGIRDTQITGKEPYPYSIEIQVIVTQPRLLDNYSCSEIRENIYNILENLTRTFPSDKDPFLEGYRCVINRYNDLPEGHIILKKDISEDYDCTKCVPAHVVEVDSILSFWEVESEDAASMTSQSSINQSD